MFSATDSIDEARLEIFARKQVIWLTPTPQCKRLSFNILIISVLHTNQYAYRDKKLLYVKWKSKALSVRNLDTLSKFKKAIRSSIRLRCGVGVSHMTCFRANISSLASSILSVALNMSYIMTTHFSRLLWSSSPSTGGYWLRFLKTVDASGHTFYVCLWRICSTRGSPKSSGIQLYLHKKILCLTYTGLFTGCDVVSAFHDKGEKSEWQT
jgi:hypothetical protein